MKKRKKERKKKEKRERERERERKEKEKRGCFGTVGLLTNVDAKVCMRLHIGAV